MLDGLAKVPDEVARAKAQGAIALSQTNHGTLAGIHPFYKECRDQGIEPILGCEFYFVPNAEHVKDEKIGERFHISILAKGLRGVEILSELSTESHKRYYYKPLLDRPLLESLSLKDRKSLVVMSGCAGSIISQKIIGDEANKAEARAELQWWKRTFPHFYIELMYHGCDFDRKLNKGLLKLGQTHNVPWVITNDSHYVMKEDCGHHDALLAIQTGSNLDDPNRFRFSGSGYHLRSHREIKRAFRSYGEEVWRPGCRETLRIAAACKTRIPAWESRSWHIPKFPDVDDSYRELRRLARRGLRDRGLDDRPEYVERVKHELKQFKAVPGMADFLLITREGNEWARSQGIRVGPGRGSVCGTLVGYLVGIHKIDSVKYKLLFERFLNPERPKMPDIDSDYASSRRDDMIEHAVRKYGTDNTVRVGAYQTMQDKGTFRSLARTFGIPFKQVTALSAKIEEDADGQAVLPPEIEKGYPELHDIMKGLSGTKKGVSRHAAGVIIIDEDDPIKKIMPIMYIPSSKRFVCQYDLDAVSDMGLMKQDYLSLRTLDTIDECIELVKRRRGVTLDPDSWVPDEGPDDKQIYKMLRKGFVSGVFQVEGGTLRRGIQSIRCNCFEDIVACTSLYRKGPLDAGADDRYLANKKAKKINVIHKTLRPYLSDSWGELIYQEQMFMILNELAGLSWAQVDDVKTAMTKKDPAKMAKLKDVSVEGFQNVAGMKKGTAEKVWAMIAAQAGYLFNRSHAVAYSLLTYQTARLKYEYPQEYLAALLRTVEPKTDSAKEKRATYIAEALRLGFKIAPPDINVSDATFTPAGTDTLTFGLQDIKGLGDAAVAKILDYRNKKAKRLKRRGLDPPKIFHNVAEVSLVTNAGVLKSLAESGTMRSLGVEPDSNRQEELLSWQFMDRLGGFRKQYENRIKLPSGKDGRVCIVGEIVSTEHKRTKNGDPFYSWLVRWQPGDEFRITVFESADELFHLRKGSVVKITGSWNTEYSNVAVGKGDQVSVLKKVVDEKKARG